MQNEMHDPEMSYRRGYHAWIAEDLLKWRVAGLKGESKRDHDGSTVMCQPPIERLSKIGG